MKDRLGSFERPRGQPLQVFALVLGGWLVLRVLLWESPFAELAPTRAVGDAFADEADAMRRTPVDPVVAAELALHGTRQALALLLPQVPHAPDEAIRETPPPPELAAAFPQEAVDCHGLLPPQCDFGAIGPVAEAAIIRSADRPPVQLAARRDAQARRWSGDAWLLLREDSARPLTAGRPAYGRSQAGAVLRYRLAPSSGHRPVAYARATRTLAGAREGEVAAGLAARLVTSLPVSFAAELRAYDSTAGREVRPAVFAVTELPPVELPLGLRGEAYAQAGYLGGTFATAFVDGQARVDTKMARLGADAELRAGAAVWGGAQKEAARLDIGPSAAASFRLGGTWSRLAVDYRLRIAGDAEPKSGPALTFSAGF